jgi:hypothetical protein
MAIKIIKKRHVEEARAPAPLIDTPPPIKAEAKHAPTELKIAPSPKPLPGLPYEKRPVADTLAEFWANQAKYRTRPPRACKLCESVYSYPCDGLNDTCMNAQWAKERKKKTKK